MASGRAFGSPPGLRSSSYSQPRMDWVAALLLGLLGGGTIGAIATALLTVSHERAERFRDRQFEAASRFIAEYEASLTATTEFWEAQTNLTWP